MSTRLCVVRPLYKAFTSKYNFFSPSLCVSLKNGLKVAQSVSHNTDFGIVHAIHTSG